MLFWALLASGQINMRKAIAEWGRPSGLVIELASRDFLPV